MTDSKVPIKIFSDKKNPRLNYVLDFIFTEKGQNFQFIEKSDAIESTQTLVYSTLNCNSDFCISPSGLLEETAINDDWKIEFNPQNDEWTINGMLDDLSILFYFLSRYEEYIDKGRDEFGRFTARQSVLFKAKQLQRPWCDIIVKNIWAKLGLDTKLLENQFKTILTYDIDIAWAYSFKPKWRTAANVLKEIFKPNELQERLAVISNKKSDPYDSYETIRQNSVKHESVLFFLLGDYGKLDKNHSWKNQKLQHLIQSFKGQTKIGIHPSFNSFLKPNKIKSEAERLNTITGQKTVLSRKHYLRMTLPESYQILNDSSITHDYSMGYAEHYGFRAGTSFPFLFFDLSINKVKPLTIIPFTFMDSTLKEYMRLSPEKAIEIVSELKNNIATVGGQFIPLWHNHSIGNQKEWKDWQVVYEACLS